MVNDTAMSTAFGAVQRVIYEKLPQVPAAFGEWLLELNYPEQELTHAIIFYGGKQDAMGRLQEYFEFEPEYEDFIAAKIWIDAMPDVRTDIEIDVSEPVTPQNEPEVAATANESEGTETDTPPMFEATRAKPHYGVAREVIRRRLPSPPLRFAEYLLWVAYPGEERRSGVVIYYGNDDTKVSFPEFKLSFAESEQDVRDAEAWIDMMPDREFSLEVDISGVRPPMRRFRRTDDFVSLDYIDCACKENYIKTAPALETIQSGVEVMCEDCLIPYIECPNSLVSDIREAGLIFDEHRVATIEFNQETAALPA